MMLGLKQDYSKLSIFEDTDESPNTGLIEIFNSGADSDLEIVLLSASTLKYIKRLRKEALGSSTDCSMQKILIFGADCGVNKAEIPITTTWDDNTSYTFS